MHPEDQNVHLLTQMIWGRTTHMGCGWIQFPVTPGSKKFEKIYPEGEFENFFVCNYGVGGNVPGEPIYNVDCEEEEDNDEDEDQKDAISDISDKLEEILQDSKPEELKVMQICLDALICLHERRDSCPESSERNCINSLNNQSDSGEIIPAERFLSNPVDKRIDILQCTTDAFLCNMKNSPDCRNKIRDCFTSTHLVSSPTTTAASTTTSTTTTTTESAQTTTNT